MRRLLKNLALYAFHFLFARPLLKWVIGARYRKSHLVPEGPCLVVSNHNSHLDAALLMTLFPLRRIPHVHPVAAADYFGSTWLKRTMAMLFMNGIPIERRPVAGRDPLAPIAEELKAGESLIFFPEGSRGEAGVVAPFRPGIGRLVRDVPGLLVVPVFMSGPERIWPRGEYVPVPLNIDVVVGRPRTYPTDVEPREIAEQVRRDVLALAPPPPPVPGPRPSPPVRVAVCGVDAAARREVVRALTERLGPMGRTLGVGDPVLEADPDGVREVTGPIPHSRGHAWLGVLARIFRTGGRFKGERFAEMVDRARTDEALGQDRNARFVVTDGNALVDLMAWTETEFYAGRLEDGDSKRLLQYVAGEKRIGFADWWKFIRRAPEVWLVNVFDLAKPPVPDVLVHVTLPVPELLRRLRTRGTALEPHHREAVLSRLQEAYTEVGAVLRRRRKVTSIEVDAAEHDPAEIAARVDEACRDLFEPPAPVEGHA